jgi:putative DNA primase/helicase
MTDATNDLATVDDLFDPLPPAEAETAPDQTGGGDGTAAPAWHPQLPAPEPLPRCIRHPTLGKPLRVWMYRDVAGAPLFAVCRFDPAGRRKQVLPYVFGTLDHRRGWHWRAIPKGRPLYGLDRLAARPGARVIVPEGEKDADGAAERFPELIAVTSSGGANAASASNWSVLRGCEVVIWSDHDAAGDGYAEAVAKLVRAAGGGPVRVVRVPPGWPKGWGLADPLPEGVDEAMLRRLLDEAVAAPVAEAPAVPLGFVLSESGVFAAGGDDAELKRVCGRLAVTAVTHDGTGRSYGRLLAWQGLDGEAHEWAMPMTLLAGDGAELRARLLDEGLDIEPGRWAREALLRYLNAARPAARARVVHRLGWHDTPAGRAFVLPETTLGPHGAPRLILQTERPDALPPVAPRGTLDEWRGTVATLCRGNSRLMLALSLSLTAPLIALLGAESGGVHLRGGSSTGKTSALIAAGSTWGGGGVRGFVRSWRATDNGLEGTAQGHCDLLLSLDEMGEAAPEAVAASAYMLANGGGKTRARADGTVRRPPEWRCLFLSTGEEGLADRLAEARGGPRRVRAGQQVRVVDVPADAGAGLGLFEELHGEATASAFAERLKAAAAAAYGTAGRAFLGALVGEDADGLVQSARASRETFRELHVPAGAVGQVVRVADRFALAAAAGEMAAALGILPWGAGEAEAAAARCFSDWLAAREGGAAAAGVAAEAGEALAQVRGFISANPARFETVGDGDTQPDPRPVIDRAGWRKRIGRAGDGKGGGAWHYCFASDAWRKVCAGLDGEAAARALRDAGFLLPQRHLARRHTRMERVGLDHPVRVYAVAEAILTGHRTRDELARADGEDAE